MTGNEPDPNCLEPEQPRISLEDAYALEGPEDNRRLYAAWASTYETDFIRESRYVYHQKVAEIFSSELIDLDGAVLDVGCGTGIVGVELRRRGVTTIDGIDISPEMLSAARRKQVGKGSVYRDLIEADLTGSTELASNTYQGIVSAGTFTHGHLGPDALDELTRIAAPGARCALGINSAHYEEAHFSEHFDRYRDNGVIGEYELVQVAIYDDVTDQSADNYANVAVFNVI